MITLEQKIDIILRYIVTEDEVEKACLRIEAFKALDNESIPAPAPIPETVPTRNEISVDDIIEELLKEIGIPYHLVGHEQIACAIKLVTADKTYADRITKGLYPAVAEICGTTSSRAERGMRHAIDCVWTSRDLDNAHALFGNTLSIHRGKPSNGEFIVACVKEVKRRIQRIK